MKYLYLLTSFALLTLITSCGKNLLIDNDMVALSQYADGVIDISSEYSAAPGPWSSFVVLGAPDTYPEYGDIQTAWAPKTRDGGIEFLTLSIDTAQYVNQIDVYETFNPGAVTSISVRNAENGSWSPVYTGDVEKNLAEKARIMKVDFPQTSYPVDAVKITMASDQVLGWNEIDAVKVIGQYEVD